MSTVAGTDGQEKLILWQLVMRTGVRLQILLGLCYSAALVLYVIARLTIGGHQATVDGNHDPKDLAPGFLRIIVLVLHAFAVIGAILGPWPAIVLGLLISVGVVLGRGTRTDNGFRPTLALAMAVFVAAVILGSVDAVSEVRHWLLD